MRKGLLAIIICSLTGGACEPLADDLEPDRIEVPIFERATKVPADAAPRRLKVMTWNIKYGACRIDFWFDGWGDRTQMTTREVRGNLAAIEALIREVDPDILFANEIEVNSRRSAYVDMVEDILENTSLNYGAYFQSWNSRYVPSEGVGRIDMGVATFSKYPITFAERIRQPNRTDQDFLTEIFYLHTVVGRARVRVGGREIGAYVTHVSAYDTDGTKQRQLKQLEELAAVETLPFVLGGDFNELPPTAAKLSDFSDEHPDLKGTEFEQPPYTPVAMQPFFTRFRSAIALDRMGTTEATQSAFYTHSIRGPHDGGFWTRTLDYLFIGNGGTWVDGTTDVLQSPGRLGIKADPNALSDHAPVVGTWELPVIGSALVLSALLARDTADVTQTGKWSVGIVDPLRIGVMKDVELVTHPIISLLASPNVQARVAFRKTGLRVTGEYGLSVPTVAMRLASGFLVPSWDKSDNRVGWFVVPSVGLALSYGSFTGRIDSAIGVPLGRNDAPPLDTWAPLELVFAPSLNGYRHHVGVLADHPLAEWLRVRGALDAWMIGPFDPPKSQLIFSASAGVDVRLSERFRLALGAILYESDQRRTVVERGDDGRWERKRVRSVDVYPTFDVIFRY